MLKWTNLFRNPFRRKAPARTIAQPGLPLEALQGISQITGIPLHMANIVPVSPPKQTTHQCVTPNPPLELPGKNLGIFLPEEAQESSEPGKEP